MGVYIWWVERQNSPAYCLRADLEYDFALIAAPAELGPCLVGFHARFLVVQTRPREQQGLPGWPYLGCGGLVDNLGERVRGEEG